MNEISDKILETIKDQGLKPVPKSKFQIRNLLLWSLFGLSILIGAVAVGVSIFVLANQEWDIYQRLGASPWKLVILALPYFWLAVFGLFIILGFYNYKKTKFGYRLPWAKLAAGYLIATLMIGGAVYTLGLGHILNKTLSERLPGYKRFNYESQFWQKADQGLLAGEIVALTPTGFILEDLNGSHWQVNALTAILQNGAILTAGQEIKIIGDRTEGNQFAAVEIRPWCGCGGCLKNTCAGGGCRH